MFCWETGVLIYVSYCVVRRVYCYCTVTTVQNVWSPFRAGFILVEYPFNIDKTIILNIQYTRVRRKTGGRQILRTKQLPATLPQALLNRVIIDLAGRKLMMWASTQDLAILRVHSHESQMHHQPTGVLILEFIANVSMQQCNNFYNKNNEIIQITRLDDRSLLELVQPEVLIPFSVTLSQSH